MRTVLHSIRPLVQAALTLACLAGCGGADDAVAPPVTPPPSSGFSVSVGLADFSAGQGQDTALRITVQRAAGLTGPITVTLDQPPAGVVAGSLVLPDAQASGVLLLSVGNEPAVGSVMPLAVKAVGPGGVAMATSKLTVTAPQPYSQDKITDALIAGTIDHGTSLLYRAYALLGDSRLPDAYLGAGSRREDNEVFTEIKAAMAGLSRAMQDQLRPFVLRPADPLSAWNATPPKALSVATAAPRMKPLALVPPGTCAGASAGAWMSKLSSNHLVRVWATCRNEGVFDAESVVLVDRTIALFDLFHGPMTALMGLPLADADGGDNAIDFYVFDDETYPYRQPEVTKAPSGRAMAVTDAAEKPKPGALGTSGFIVMSRNMLYTNVFRGVAMHEFFHVLQFAHNSTFMSRPVPGNVNPDVRENHWFKEASAHWAEAYFDRTIAGLEGERIAYQDVYRLFKQYFQPGHESLNKPGPNAHEYAAFIWPYFVEQQTGGPQFMADMWTKLETATTFEEADQLLDVVFSFYDNFKTFALRNLNTEFLPGDPLPAETRYAALDKALFVDDKKEPPYEPSGVSYALTAGNDYTQAIDLGELSARYVRLVTGDASIQQVVVDISGLQRAFNLDVQALVRTDDGWVSKPIDIGPGRSSFCFDKGPTTVSTNGSFKEILLVISNHSLYAGDKVTGTLAVQPLASVCPAYQVATGGEFPGEYFSMAIKADGQVYTWGANGSGQLGRGQFRYDPTPSPIGIAGDRFVKIAAGGRHGVALTASGQVYTWGENKYGQLGVAPDPGNSGQVFAVAGLPPIRAIAAGVVHTIAVAADGRVYGWGANYGGQVSPLLPLTSLNTPMLIPGTNGDAVEAASGGIAHSVVLSASGRVQVWGDTRLGQAGDGIAAKFDGPRNVFINALRISASRNDTYVLDNTGVIWSTGENSVAQLGNGLTSNGSSLFTATLDSVRGFACDGASCLAIRNDRTLWGWGQNNYSQLCSGTASAQTLVPTRAPLALDVAAVAVNSQHALFVTGNGDVWACGNNDTGQMGNIGTGSTVPVQVPSFNLAK